MKPLTVKDLMKECTRLIRNGQGDKTIMLSDDDEGNGYHYCRYTFSTPDEVMIEDYFIDEEIAKKEDTIILG